eukprot:748712-Hanusia_phi.AAC.3
MATESQRLAFNVSRWKLLSLMSCLDHFSAVQCLASLSVQIQEMEANRNGEHGKKASGKGRAAKGRLQCCRYDCNLCSGQTGSIDLCEIVGRLIHQKALHQKAGRKIKSGL